MKLFAFLIPVLLFGFFSLVPAVTHAADFTLSPSFHIIPEECHCPQSAPDFGCVLAVIQNVMNFAISIGFIIFIFVLSYAGFLFMTNPTNSHAREQGNHMITNAVVGLLIALSAWLIVDFVMKTLYNQATFGPWNSILTTKTDGTELGAEAHCIKVVTPPAGAAGTQTSNNGNGGVTTSTGSSNGGATGSAATCTRPNNGTVANGGCCQGNANACQTGLTCDTTTNRCKAADTTSTGNTGTEAAVRQQLSSAGISVNNADACPAGETYQAYRSRTGRRCTTVGGLTSATVSHAINMARAWGGFQITGGSEAGHATHDGGNRFDATGSIGSHIRSLPAASAAQMQASQIRAGTSGVYADSCGNTYFDEGDHWHITVFSACSNL